jgi:hypothetical protein
MIRTIVACGLAGLATGAAAQVTGGGAVTYALSWRECNETGGTLPNADGLLSPGEHALLQLSVAFTGQNTVATFSPAIGTFASGTIRGYGMGFLDLHGSSQTEGMWNVDNSFGFGVDPAWDLIGFPGSGTPVAGGTQLLNIQMGQFPVSIINTTNPVQDIWIGIWTPNSYAPRQVTFMVVPAAISFGQHSALILRTGAPTPVGVFCDAVFGSVEVDVGGTAPCYANCDGSTMVPVLTVLDFSCFLNAYAAGSSYANCDGNTNPPLLTVLDFGCFLNRFAAGCT